MKGFFSEEERGWGKEEREESHLRKNSCRQEPALECVLYRDVNAVNPQRIMPGWYFYAPFTDGKTEAPLRGVVIYHRGVAPGRKGIWKRSEARSLEPRVWDRVVLAVLQEGPLGLFKTETEHR